MSVEKRQPEAAFKVALLWGLFACSGIVAADDDVMPDMEFLEYLGLWEESDEDWLIFNVPMSAETDERSDPVPEGEEPTEKDNES